MLVAHRIRLRIGLGISLEIVFLVVLLANTAPHLSNNVLFPTFKPLRKPKGSSQPEVA